MTGNEIVNISFSFFQSNDKKGFDHFKTTLSEDEIKNFEATMDEYQMKLEKAQKW